MCPLFLFLLWLITCVCMGLFNSCKYRASKGCCWDNSYYRFSPFFGVWEGNNTRAILVHLQLGEKGYKSGQVFSRWSTLSWWCDRSEFDFIRHAIDEGNKGVICHSWRLNHNPVFAFGNSFTSMDLKTFYNHRGWREEGREGDRRWRERE